MSDTQHCPDCGRPNAGDAAACSHCNFPLIAAAESKPSATPEEAGAPPTESPEVPEIRRFRPIRPRRPEPMAPLQTQLWLFAGAAIIVLLVIQGVQGFRKSNVTPIEGAKVEQQKLADEARAALAKDSTNVEARIALANLLYDTKNWSEAIVHYKSAARLDPKRTTTVVDLGVCYYNLGHASEAKAQFEAALALDPHQPVALFNLGIVAESRESWEEALQFYHRALQADPPEGMKPPLMEHMNAVMVKLGKTAPEMPTTP